MPERHTTTVPLAMPGIGPPAEYMQPEESLNSDTSVQLDSRIAASRPIAASIMIEICLTSLTLRNKPDHDKERDNADNN